MDHFPILLTTETENRMTSEGKVQGTKSLINSKTKEKFKNTLREMTWDDVLSSKQTYQCVIFKPLSYCFEETIGFDVKASFTSRPVSRPIS